MADQSLGRW